MRGSLAHARRRSHAIWAPTSSGHGSGRWGRCRTDRDSDHPSSLDPQRTRMSAVSAATPDAPTRRRALRIVGGAATTAAVATGALAAPAAAVRAKVSYRPGHHPQTPVLKPAARHLVNRFSYGITPQLAAEVRACGGHLAWFDQQLATAYDGSADNLCDWWPDLHLDAVTLWERNKMGVRGGWEVMWD